MTRQEAMMQTSKLTLLLLLITGVALRALAATAAEPQTFGDFATALVSSFNKRDKQAVIGLFDLQTFAARAAKSATDNPVERSGFATGIVEQAASVFLPTFVDQIALGNGKLRYLRSLRIADEERLLVRADYGDKGWDYLEFVVERNAVGRYKIIDWYQLSTSQLMSDTLGSVGHLFLDPNPSLLQRLLGMSRISTEARNQLLLLGKLNRAGKFREALDLMEKLPRELRDTRFILRLRILLATKADDQPAYLRLLNEFATKYGDDPADAFLLLDHYFNEKDAAKVMRAVDLVERRIGPDSVLQVVRASAQMLTPDYAQCVAFAKDAIQLEPDSPTAYVLLAKCYTGLKQYRAAVATLQSFATQFRLQLSKNELAADADFADLIKSAEFKAWLPK